MVISLCLHRVINSGMDVKKNVNWNRKPGAKEHDTGHCDHCCLSQMSLERKFGEMQLDNAQGFSQLVTHQITNLCMMGGRTGLVHVPDYYLRRVQCS